MNQNPDVSVTANSIVSRCFNNSQFLKNEEVYQNYQDEESLNNVTRGIIPNYYYHWKSNHIIDRSMWGLSDNFDMLKKFAPNNIKVIVPVRDLKEILASFIKFSYSTTDNYIAKNASSLVERCEYVTGDRGTFRKWIECVWNLNKPENRKYCYFMEYDDLISNPKKIISEVYKFLNIDTFEHKFTDLNQLENNGIKYDDTVLGGDLHKIKVDKIEKSDYDMWEYLPSDVDKRYRLDPFWRE